MAHHKRTQRVTRKLGANGQPERGSINESVAKLRSSIEDLDTAKSDTEEYRQSLIERKQELEGKRGAAASTERNYLEHELHEIAEEIELIDLVKQSHLRFLDSLPPQYLGR